MVTKLYSKYILNVLFFKQTFRDKDKEILFQVFKTHRKNM